MYRASSKMKSILMILVVTSVRSTSATTLYDLAQGRQAAQSSTLRDANLAIRGKTWPRDIDTCSATEDTDNDPWWQVDLGTEREVSRVFVQGHEYDYSKRRKLENFNIFVSNLPASENGLPTKSRLCHANTNKLTNEKMGKFKCAEPIKGRYVIITSPAKFGKLELCGVHVYEECKTGDCKIDTCMDLSSPKRCALAALRGCQDYSFLKSSEQCRATCKLCKPESGIPKGLSSESDVIGKTIEMTGPATSTRDDAASEVTCPEGYFVVQCRCSSQVDCDSNMVIGNNTCRVTHTHGRPVVKVLI
ncbi:uncharacterized protein LOC141912232 [Tubulanus polymorphus]|uniref:uncharacterized protein LOC141912232 n=1 Tax=Tubulanus polymorphus TaxID=672921 RepID=UPI003DA31B62